MELQLDAVGTDLRLPEADYAIVCATELGLGFEERRELERHADTHGGVLFRQRDQAGTPWQRSLIFRPAVPWSVLDLAGSTSGIAGEHLALLALDPGAEARDARHARAGFVIAYDDARGRIWESDHWILRPHPLVALEPMRDWSWVWEHATYGPISIRIRIEHRHDLDRFLATCLPMPYQQIADGHYRVASDAVADLRFLDDGIELTRGHLQPAAGVVAFDAGLLVALANRALGRIGWEVVDEDFYEHLAAGDDGSSLLAYLDPANDADHQRRAWKRELVPRRFDASASVTPGQLVETLSLLLGARAAIPDHLFDAWLAALPLESLPRSVEIQVSRLLYDRFGVQWLLGRLGRAQPRVAWSTRVS